MVPKTISQNLASPRLREADEWPICVHVHAVSVDRAIRFIHNPFLVGSVDVICGDPDDAGRFIGVHLLDQLSQFSE